MTAVFGVEVTDLVDGYVPLEVVVLVKALDDEGHVTLVVKYSPDLSSVEALGMLTIARRTLEDNLAVDFEADD